MNAEFSQYSKERFFLLYKIIKPQSPLSFLHKDHKVLVVSILFFVYFVCISFVCLVVKIEAQST